MRSLNQAKTLAAAALLMSTGVAGAETLKGEDIRREIIGHTIFLAAPVTGEFPLNYRTSGIVDGDGAALGLGRFIQPKDQGRWWINGDRLCQKFTTWYQGAPMCFELSRAGEGRVKWVRDNGEAGVARIAR